MILLPGANAYDQRKDGLPPIECENFYAERVPTDVGTDWVLVSTPGQVAVSARTGNARGGFSAHGVFDGDIFTLYDNTLTRMNEAGVVTAIPGVVTGGGRAIFTSVRGFLVFTTGGEGWVYDGTSVVQVTDADLPPVGSVAAMDGRVIFTETGTDRVWWSGIFDPTNIDVLAFATAETFEDDLVRIIADHRELWLFGQRTIEVWRPVSNSEQPFQRVGDMVIQKGCISPHSISRVDNSLFWVGHDAIVYKAEGVTPRRISNHGIENLLSDLTQTELEGVYAFSYTDDGHSFYALTIPGKKTFVFDASTQQWHTRKTSGQDIWFVYDYVEAFSSHYAITATGINTLSRDALTDAGQPIIRKASANLPTHVPTPIERVALVTASLDVGGAELDVNMNFEFSDDAGRTYSAVETVPVYQNGLHAQRVTIFRQGQAQSPGRTYRITTDGTASRIMLGPVFVNEAEH